MDKQTLEAKLLATEKQFNEVQDQKRAMEEEMLRLQGQYKGYADLLKEFEETPKVEDATTVDVEPTLKEEDKNANSK